VTATRPIPLPGHQSSVVGRQSRPTTEDRRPTTIYLIRHGETDWNRAGLLQGTSDIPLNRAGRQQAERLAERLAGVSLDAAYTSPLRRARATAEAVLSGRALPLVELPELREICYGLWQGRGAAPRGRCNPGLEWRWRSSPWRVRFPGGESLMEVEERVAGALRRIHAEHPGRNVLLSGHGHLNRVLLIHALGWPRERFWEIDQPNGCCRVLRWSASDATLYPLER
jgi:broad specificity phosphatase PhoE